MQILEPKDIPDFLERFQNFYDAVLHDFPCKPGSKTSCKLTFEAEDMSAESGWSLVTIRMENVTSWKFAMSLNCAYSIMSGGVHVLYEDGLFYMDVGTLWDTSDNINDYLSSDFHFIARVIRWEAMPIE